MAVSKTSPIFVRNPLASRHISLRSKTCIKRTETLETLHSLQVKDLGYASSHLQIPAKGMETESIIMLRCVTIVSTSENIREELNAQRAEDKSHER